MDLKVCDPFSGLQTAPAKTAGQKDLPCLLHLVECFTRSKCMLPKYSVKNKKA